MIISLLKSGAFAVMSLDLKIFELKNASDVYSLMICNNKSTN
jgi:hypothetical protein